MSFKTCLTLYITLTNPSLYFSKTRSHLSGDDLNGHLLWSASSTMDPPSQWVRWRRVSPSLNMHLPWISYLSPPSPSSQHSRALSQCTCPLWVSSRCFILQQTPNQRSCQSFCSSWSTLGLGFTMVCHPSDSTRLLISQPPTWSGALPLLQVDPSP